jgi:RNA polymerase sigma-70 factor, ECF subfamily
MHDSESAKDIVQDVYVSFLQAKNGFSGTSSLKTYLYRAVINKSIDTRRRQQRFRGFLDCMGREAQPAVPDAAGEMENKELVRRLLAAVPELYRIPFCLAEVDGMSYQEISDVLGISLSTVRIRIFRCREKMRNELHKLGRLP